MGRPPASTEEELRLVDALSRLPARKVAELVWGDAGLRDRVLRRRRQRRRTRIELTDEQVEAYFASLREEPPKTV
jgi:hypothetical protein